MLNPSWEFELTYSHVMGSFFTNWSNDEFFRGMWFPEVQQIKTNFREAFQFRATAIIKHFNVGILLRFINY